MSEIRVNTLGNESNTGGPVLSGITEFSGQQYFIPPTGTTAERPSGCPPGSIRFNTDSAHLEYWNGLVWLEFEASSVELGDQNNTNSTGGTGVRGLFAGGQTPTKVNTIEYVSISTLGNAIDFGDLTQTAYNAAGGCASRTRGIRGGGQDGGGATDTIDFVTIASTGNAIDFGNLAGNQVRAQLCALSNQTRGIFAGGYTPTAQNNIQSIEIASTGDAVDFGNLLAAAYGGAATSSSVRGVIMSGYASGTVNTVQYITISTSGDAQDFGDLTVARRNGRAACSSPTRGIFAAGESDSPFTNVIDFVTIASTGDAEDFGDLTSARQQSFACSNGHGGL